MLFEKLWLLTEFLNETVKLSRVSIVRTTMRDFSLQ